MPGFKILGQAFWLITGNFFTLLRLTWLPIATMIAAQIAIGQALARMAGGTTADALAASPLSEPAFYLSAVLQVIALSVAAVRVHEFALFDERRPGQYFAFPFGRTEAWYVLMVAALIGASIAIGVAVLAYLQALHDAGLPVLLGPATQDDLNSAYLTVLFYAPLGWAFLWFASRVGLWPAAVVANRGFGLADAWRVTRGLGLPMYFLVLAAGQFVGLALYIRAFAADPHRTREFLEQMGEHAAPLSWRTDPIAFTVFPNAQRYAVLPTPEQLALDFALTLFVLSFMAALISFAYLSQTREEPSLSFGPSTVR